MAVEQPVERGRFYQFPSEVRSPTGPTAVHHSLQLEKKAIDRMAPPTLAVELGDLPPAKSRN
jgi:hypothetical protein